MIDFDKELERIKLIKELKANPVLLKKMQQLHDDAVVLVGNGEFLMEIERRERILDNLLDLARKRGTKQL